jgi:4-hydroxy-3-methylbut-2-enyl diphosphate reductase
MNFRSPEIMPAVQRMVESHYRSSLIESMRANSFTLEHSGTTIQLAREFGFCYGVERAIDLAYAARKVFPDARFFLVGEIIHNPLVNEHIAALGILNLLDESGRAKVEELRSDDVVIVPAFGVEVSLMERIRQSGCRIVDTTCGDVMSVWRRVRKNAEEGVTSIIHGKAAHEETRATVSRAIGDGVGHFLIVFDVGEAEFVCEHIRGYGNRAAFLEKFSGKYSEGFDPDIHLSRIGVANQTTMFRAETEAVQRLLREALLARDGHTKNFRSFDTICGATQDRQDALKTLLSTPLDLLVVVGGYNSSNTTHLAEIGARKVPTWFVRNQACLESIDRIRHFDLATKREVVSGTTWLPLGELRIGVTAGASCPNNLIEEVIQRILELRGDLE